MKLLQWMCTSRANPSNPLGRWCHETSEVVGKTCDQGKKAVWNLYDHGFHTLPPPPLPPPQPYHKQDPTRDPITVFLYD